MALIECSVEHLVDEAGSNGNPYQITAACFDPNDMRGVDH